MHESILYCKKIENEKNDETNVVVEFDEEQLNWYLSRLGMDYYNVRDEDSKEIIKEHIISLFSARDIKVDIVEKENYLDLTFNKEYVLDYAKKVNKVEELKVQAYKSVHDKGIPLISEYAYNLGEEFKNSELYFHEYALQRMYQSFTRPYGETLICKLFPNDSDDGYSNYVEGFTVHEFMRGISNCLLKSDENITYRFTLEVMGDYHC